jgi:hypothetical protein
MIKLIDILKEITLLEYNKSQLDYIAVKLNVEDRSELNSLMNALDSQGIKYPDLKKQIEAGTLKTIEDLKKLKTVSKKDVSKSLESDYETIIDNPDVLIVSPHTHEASRKLGLSQFAFRDCEEGGKDSAWCTTYKAPDHFNSYYYQQGVTFYYVKIKSPKMMEEIKKVFPKNWKNLEVVALVVNPSGKIKGYDGKDKLIPAENIKIFTDIIGIS